MAARPGYLAELYRVDRRFGGRRVGCDNDLARSRARPAATRRHDAALALARHGGDRRDVRNKCREGPAGTRDIIQTMAGAFLGEAGDRQDPLANPLHADLKGFPPIYIQTGADETLLDDSRKLADLARRSGVEVTLEIVPGMQHVFQFLAGTAPEADAAISRLAAWVRPQLGLG